MAKLFRVILPVTDIEQAAEFYTTLLRIPGRRVSPGRHYFDCGGTLLVCFDPQADGDRFMLEPNPEHFYFSVPDLESIFARAQLLECQSVDEEIQQQPWGERCFYARDPFGNPICFVDETTVFKGDRELLSFERIPYRLETETPSDDEL